MALIPVDEKQCQTEITSYRPFVMGGNVNQVERCKERPAFIATERKAGPDGLKGAMSLCPECKDRLVKQFREKKMPLPKFTVIDRNPKKKKEK